MKRIVQFGLGVMMLLSLVGLSVSQTPYIPSSGESLVSYHDLKRSVDAASKILSEFRKEGKRLVKFLNRVRQLERENVWGPTMRYAKSDLELSFQRLVNLRAILATAVLDSHSLVNCKEVAESFGWTKSQIMEIDSFNEVSVKLFRKMKEIEVPSDEDVRLLLDRVDQSMQSRLVYYTGRFYMVSFV